MASWHFHSPLPMLRLLYFQNTWLPCGIPARGALGMKLTGPSVTKTAGVEFPAYKVGLNRLTCPRVGRAGLSPFLHPVSTIKPFIMDWSCRGHVSKPNLILQNVPAHVRVQHHPHTEAFILRKSYMPWEIHINPIYQVHVLDYGEGSFWLGSNYDSCIY